jgi:hypothetical protein
MKNPKESSGQDTTPATPVPPSEAPAKPAPAEAKQPNFVFKILPANPKNAFDFEDVADK